MEIHTQDQSKTKQDRIRLEIDFSDQTPELVDTPYGVFVKLDDCAPSGELGGPALPSRVIRVALPPFTRVTSVEGISRESHLLSTRAVMPVPLQAPRPGTIEDAAHKLESPEVMDAEVFSHKASTLLPPQPLPRTITKRPAYVAPKEALYADELRSPRPPAQLAGEQTIGLQPVALIQLNPVLLNADGFLEFRDVIDLTVSFEPLFTPAALTEKNRTETKTEASTAADLRAPFLRRIPSRRHAQHQLARLRQQVVNTDWIWDFSQLFSEAIQTEYLIITDDNRWDESNIVPTGHAGHLVDNFERLIDWKQERGLKARLVTISDIVDGEYGDFTTNARDLQEVIRNFIKWSYENWGISWLLLGGDINILPVRRVAGASEGHINPADIDPPEPNQSFWTGNFLKMHVVDPGLMWPGMSIQHRLVNPETGMAIPFDPTGNLPLPRSWHFTTDDTYTTLTNVPTQFVRVNGPAADINARLQWLYHWNMIPTDLYYASLTGEHYNQPNLHDWDLLNNGIYGQHTNGDDFDGVDYNTDISVGRAPVANTDEAMAFVNKVITYERLKTPAGEQLDWNWPRRLLLVSSNWGDRAHIGPTNNNPPTGDYQYFHAPGSNHSLMRLGQDAPEDLEWRLMSKLNGSSRTPVLPYDRDAATSGEGWYFAISDTNTSPSEVIIFGMTLAVPTQWIVVYADADEVAPEYFIFDRTTPELSMTDQERLRRQITSDQPRIDWVNRIYQDEIDLSPQARAACPVSPLAEESVQGALNYGQHFVSLSGHGYQGGCCYVDSDNVQDLTNGYHTFIGYADSCLTAAYDEDDAAGEYAVNNPLGGGVAYVGNSRFSWIGVGDNFQRKFFKTLNSTQHLGLLNDSRCDAVFDNTGFYRLYSKWVAFSLNLLGDPEMPVWIGTPRPFKGRYLGNTNHTEVHDLHNETNRCQIDEIIRANHARVFDTDTLEQAHEEHYDNCAFCIGNSRR